MALFFYKEKNKDIRAAAYLRLSIEDGDKAESNSIGNQRELIRDFAAERPGLHLIEEYADDGYTGTNFERPGFKRMMEDIKSGKINCIIVKDLSRLGRNYIEITVLRGFSICWAVCYWQRRFFRTSCISRKEWKHFKC